MVETKKRDLNALYYPYVDNIDTFMTIAHVQHNIYMTYRIIEKQIEECHKLFSLFIALSQ